jgi:hypothetical protein
MELGRNNAVAYLKTASVLMEIEYFNDLWAAVSRLGHDLLFSIVSCRCLAWRKHARSYNKEREVSRYIELYYHAPNVLLPCSSSCVSFSKASNLTKIARYVSTGCLESHYISGLQKYFAWKYLSKKCAIAICLRASLLLGMLCGATAISSQSRVSAMPAEPTTGSEVQSLLQASINAMGGKAAWAAISDVTVSGTCQSNINGGESSTPVASFRWVTAQEHFRYETNAPGGTSVIISGHGKPSLQDSKGSKSLTGETAFLSKPFHLPGKILLTVLSDSNYYATITGTEVIAGAPATHLHIAHYLHGIDYSPAGQDWWIDDATKLPLKVTYRAPGQATISYVPITQTFSEWKIENGSVAIPHKIDFTLLTNIHLKSCTIDDLQTNTNPSSSIFDAR